MEIKLQKPLNKDGKTIKTISLNLDSLSGSDIISIERELRQRGDTSLNPLISSEGLAVVAARASGFVPEDIISLSAPDFIQVTGEVRNFLLGWVLTIDKQ
jgi:hypothetical protein